jgi:hypothetical protein
MNSFLGQRSIYINSCSLHDLLLDTRVLPPGPGNPCRRAVEEGHDLGPCVREEGGFASCGQGGTQAGDVGSPAGAGEVACPLQNEEREMCECGRADCGSYAECGVKS